VKVDNDSASQLRLMKKSIRHVTQRDRQVHGPLVNGTPKAKEAPNMVEVDEKDIRSLLNDLSSLKKA
jgi:hypothetical protein